MKQIISIEKDTEIVPDKVLCEWGEQHCCIAGWSSAQSKITTLQYHTFSAITESQTTQLLQAIKSISDKNAPVTISSAFPQALLVPDAINTADDTLLTSFYGPEATNTLTDTIEQWDVVNVYAFPTALLELLNHHFPNAAYIHAFTAGLKVYSGFIANDSLTVHFLPSHFRVVVKKEGKPLLAQMYPYRTPLDVVYYLLKIGEELSLPKEALYVVISGLIEEASALHQELTNYFQNVQFAATPNLAPQSSYPAHYFSSIYNLSACV